ncbi:MAG: DUF1828 domain-containing protein [bacterium]
MNQEIISKLKTQFNGRVSFSEKRPGIWQMYLPFYHEDGDMVEVYLQKEGKGWKICDYAMAVMRLSYQYDIDTENKEKIFQKMISENGLQEDDGNIFICSDDDDLYPAIMQFVQGVSKITSMRYFRREIVESLFFEQLDEYINAELQSYNPRKKVIPIKDRDDLEADYQFTPDGYPVFLFGVKDVARARLAAICCLEYQKQLSKFRSYVVHEDFTKIPQKDITRLTSACDKQFVSLDDFRDNAAKSLDREK